MVYDIIIIRSTKIAGVMIMKESRDEILVKALTDIINEEIDKISDPSMTNKERFEKISGKALARFKEEFPNVDVLKLEESDGGFDLSLCEHALH